MLELVSATILCLVCGWLIGTVFAIGFGLGLAVHAYLAVVYKRNAAGAVARAYEDAKNQHLENMRRAQERKRAYDESPYPKNAQDAQDSFEESVATLFPGDKALQEEARRAREARQAGG